MHKYYPFMCHVALFQVHLSVKQIIPQSIVLMAMMGMMGMTIEHIHHGDTGKEAVPDIRTNIDHLACTTVVPSFLWGTSAS